MELELIVIMSEMPEKIETFELHPTFLIVPGRRDFLTGSVGSSEPILLWNLDCINYVIFDFITWLTNIWLIDH
ncbi:MAG: hypothetical protein Ta2E_11700 [Mycoplasmoidaceae bacterium]|nr:MAG: hypothetical protein Ta2E_11700 [Mycoplasmoidaceae bacterium]